MEKYKWSYCLTDVQYNRLIRIINKIPGLSAYLDINDNPSLIDIVRAFRNYTDSEGITTTGMRVNSEVLIKWYDLYQKEYAETHKSNNSYSSFRLDRILTWNPRPQWSSNMKVEEIDYLDHFIPKVPGLSNFLYGEKDKSNLYDLVVYFQMRLNATGVNEPEINFLLETIKERFYRIMDDHQDAIHYVNHSHQINDSELISQFQEQAEKEFYKVNLEKNICSNFTNRYINCSNPYIAGEIFLRFFRANKIDIALIFVQKAFTYIFSAPNIYWHNKEAVFGSVNIVYTLIEALGYEGVVKLKESYSNVSKSLLETAYLLLSRTIYWYDKETYKDETYDDLKRPISIQHKLRAYRLRAYLTETFGEFFFPKTNEVERNMMTLADMLSAHEVAYANKIVGRESIFRQDAIKLFHTKGLFKRPFVATMLGISEGTVTNIKNEFEGTEKEKPKKKKTKRDIKKEQQKKKFEALAENIHSYVESACNKVKVSNKELSFKYDSFEDLQHLLELINLSSVLEEINEDESNGEEV